MPVPYQHVPFDEHRNSSRVFPVPEGAADEALRTLARFKANEPALYAWIAEGAPLLTEQEHRRRFGCDYKPPARSKR